ncbi:MAG: hypothetical protein WA621_14025 [Candidatus Acidiferrum sp.]|jgi:hypothetical protein
MNIGKTLVFIEIVLMVAAVSLGHHWWILAAEAFLRLAAAALISAGAI